VSRVAVILSTLGVALIAAWGVRPDAAGEPHRKRSPAAPKTAHRRAAAGDRARRPPPVVTTKVVAPPREEVTAIRDAARAA